MSKLRLLGIAGVTAMMGVVSLGGGIASAFEAPAGATLTVAAATVNVGGSVSVTGTGCYGQEVLEVPAPDGTITPNIEYLPAEVVLSLGEYLIPIAVSPSGTWSYTLPVGMRRGLQNDMPGNPDIFGSPPGTYQVSATCDSYAADFEYPATAFTVVDPDPAKLTVIPQTVTADMLTDPDKGVVVQASSFTPGTSVDLVDVTVSYPDGSVATLDQELIGADGTASIPLYYDGATPPLGTYTVTVSNYYESASATFTVVPTQTNRKDSKDLAATGVKLDVPMALSTGGLLLVAGAGAMVFARRREN